MLFNRKETLKDSYVGAISYVHDITLLCPSIRGFNEMLSICCEYADDYEHVYINNTLVQWTNEVKHLGNVMQSSLSDAADCRFKRSMFIGYVNKLI